MPYYKKVNPRQALQISGGRWLRFDPIDYDIGVFGTEDTGMIKEVEAAISEHRGGVERIDSQEYLELQAKKKDVSKSRWREEFSPQTLKAAAAKRGPVESSTPSPSATVPLAANRQPEVLEGFRPKASK